MNRFFSLTGLLGAKTDHKVITEVVQDGNDFTWTQSIPNWKWSNTFSVGQECELVTMKGTQFKVSGREPREPSTRLSMQPGLSEAFLTRRLQFIWRTEGSQYSFLSTTSRQRSPGTS